MGNIVLENKEKNGKKVEKNTRTMQKKLYSKEYKYIETFKNALEKCINIMQKNNTFISRYNMILYLSISKNNLNITENCH